MKNTEYNYKEYEEMFNLAMNSNTAITTQDGTEELYITDGEKWKQCYKPGDKVREQFPKYWFISDLGNLVSVSKNKAYLLKKDMSGNNDRASYHFNICIGDDVIAIKNIECHNLVRIVFGGLSYGKADELLKKEGVFAFGVKNNAVLKINGHHMNNNPIDNNPTNIELITTEAHKIIDKVPKKTGNDITVKFLTEFESMALNEEPEKISVLFTGQSIDKETLEPIKDNGSRVLYTTDRILLSQQAADEFTALKEQLHNIWVIKKVIDALVQYHGADYFIEPKYFCSSNLFYKCEKTSETVSIKELTNNEELIGKHIIMCHHNKDNLSEIYIDVQQDDY